MSAVKLKRFLLRYEPPGIGLEICEDKENIQVVHKDLPAAESIGSGKDIYDIVDDLIASEEFLTKRRHRTALITLIARLYQVEVDAQEEEEKDGPSPAQKTAEARSPVDQGAANSSYAAPASPVDAGIQEGTQVVLIQLKGKLQVYNGEVATVTKARSDKQKYEVYIALNRSEPETLKIKGAEHMVPVAKGAALTVATHVAIRGLRNHVELNGCLGRVVECHEESHRFEVRATDSGQLFRVKQENLVAIEAIGAAVVASKENREPNTAASPRLKKDASGPSSSTAMGGAGAESAASLAAAPAQRDALGDGAGEGDTFEPGSIVQLVGLKTAMCYNGQQAEVMSVDRARCRYEIRLGDGSVKTIRAENVRLVSGPSKTSPRTRRGKDGASGKEANRK